MFMVLVRLSVDGALVYTQVVVIVVCMFLAFVALLMVGIKLMGTWLRVARVF